MSVLRIHKKSQNFVILDKTCLKDIFLSWGAKGLHAYLMSMPDDWRVKVCDLQKHATNGRDAVRGLLRELEQAGYISKSVCRGNSSGKFEGIEYVVYEVPQIKTNDEPPAPENPSPVAPHPEKPAPGKPFTDNPPLLSNKYNNKLLTKKTAAANNTLEEASIEQSHAAAVFFENKLVNEFPKPIKHQDLNFLTPNDSVIGEALTPNQLRLVEAILRRLNCSTSEALFEEISYCLLSKKHFTGCGQDFGRKLNAIRTVILRGDWQRPAELVIKEQEKTSTTINQLEKELRDVRAEAMHFQRLLADVKLPLPTREQFKVILTQAQSKISSLETEIRKVSSYCEARAS